MIQNYETDPWSPSLSNYNLRTDELFVFVFVLDEYLVPFIFKIYFEPMDYFKKEFKK